MTHRSFNNKIDQRNEGNQDVQKQNKQFSDLLTSVTLWIMTSNGLNKYHFYFKIKLIGAQLYLNNTLEHK